LRQPDPPLQAIAGPDTFIQVSFDTRHGAIAARDKPAFSQGKWKREAL